MNNHTYHSKIHKRAAVLVVGVILAISSVSYGLININSAQSEIVEIASVSTSEILDKVVSVAKDRLVSVHYEAINTPNNADMQVISSDLNNFVAYTANNVDLSQRLSYSFNTELKNGAYALMITSPDIVTKITPFLIEDDKGITVNIGSFASYQS